MKRFGQVSNHFSNMHETDYRFPPKHTWEMLVAALETLFPPLLRRDLTRNSDLHILLDDLSANLTMLNRDPVIEVCGKLYAPRVLISRAIRMWNCGEIISKLRTEDEYSPSKVFDTTVFSNRVSQELNYQITVHPEAVLNANQVSDEIATTMMQIGTHDYFLSLNNISYPDYLFTPLTTTFHDQANSPMQVLYTCSTLTSSGNIPIWRDEG